MAGPDDEMIEAFLTSSRERHRPAAVRTAPCALYPRPQADERLDREMRGIAVKIGTQLPVRGKVRVIRRHRIVFELGQWLRGDDMRRKIDAGPVAFFAKHPIAADGIALVVAHDVAQSGREQILERGEAAGACADDADARLRPAGRSRGDRRTHGRTVCPERRVYPARTPKCIMLLRS